VLYNLRDILSVAKENKFAVPAFNCSNEIFLKGILEACESEKAPVIIEVHPNELKFGTESFIRTLRAKAGETVMPICIHLDHGSSFEQAMEAIRCGFTSVMIDASKKSFEENIELTKKVVEAAHSVGVSVEAELGTIGGTGEDGNACTDNIIYTRAEDVKAFVEATNVDALAIAIGTAHGIYPKDQKPHLRIDILKEIRAITDIPLVLHGGSDNPDSEVAAAVEAGVQKINISSDIKKSFFKECREVLKNEKLMIPRQIFIPSLESMKETVIHKIRLFNDNDKIKCFYN